MKPPLPQALQAARTYNAAADHFDAEPLAFWERIGKRTVEHLAPGAGQSILDVGCGSGASALPAAKAVGPSGSVVGVDVAENLLSLGREKAQRAGLRNVTFQSADMTRLDFPEESFDAVICVFAIFFTSDMERQLRRLWRLVRPGGAMAITTWGPAMLEPGSSAFWRSLSSVRPDLVARFNPWDRISAPGDLERLFIGAGVGVPVIAAENSEQQLSSPEAWWRVALGSGFRWTINQLSAAEAEQVRRDNIARLEAMGTGAVATNALYAIARKEA